MTCCFLSIFTHISSNKSVESNLCHPTLMHYNQICNSKYSIPQQLQSIMQQICIHYSMCVVLFVLSHRYVSACHDVVCYSITTFERQVIKKLCTANRNWKEYCTYWHTVKWPWHSVVTIFYCSSTCKAFLDSQTFPGSKFHSDKCSQLLL